MKSRQTNVRAHRCVALAAGALALVAALAGCSTPPPPSTESGGLPPNTARVVINGRDLGVTKDVDCTQVRWTWIIKVGDQDSGATAVFETGGGPLKARSVQLRDVDGFSGSYWDGNHGDAHADIVDGAWTISGSVEGFNIDDGSIDDATRTFSITANC